MVDILPESRPRERKGAVQTANGWMIPIYCANCGKSQGMVPEKMITFAFALCQGCCDKHGTPAHMMMEPDAVFWRRVHEAMAEERVESLTLQEMTQHAEDPSSSLGKLLRERYAVLKREA
jgi:hypothetical protein